MENIPLRRAGRRNPRLHGVEYDACADYFVTICMHRMRCRLGRVVEDRVRLSDAGHMVRQQWLGLEQRYPFVELDEFVVMPNHLHGIVGLRAGEEVGSEVTSTLSGVIGRFKTGTTYLYGEGVRRRGWARYDGRLWQRGFWDRIVRNERELEAIRNYVIANPIQWHLDRLNPRGRNWHDLFE